MMRCFSGKAYAHAARKAGAGCTLRYPLSVDFFPHCAAQAFVAAPGTPQNMRWCAYDHTAEASPYDCRRVSRLGVGPAPRPLQAREGEVVTMAHRDGLQDDLVT